jgi:pimeloyl-ACP methyl ester carboxylesterase
MPGGDKSALHWIGEMQGRSASARNARLLWDAFHRFDVREIAATIDAPTLVFHARGDAMVPFDAGRHFASLIPNARFVPLESSNHILLAGEAAGPRSAGSSTSFSSRKPVSVRSTISRSRR